MEKATIFEKIKQTAEKPLKVLPLPERYLRYIFHKYPDLRFTTIREFAPASKLYAVGILSNGCKILFPLSFLDKGRQEQIANNNYVIPPLHATPMQFTDPRGTTDQERSSSEVVSQGFDSAHVDAYVTLCNADVSNSDKIKLYSIELYVLHHWIKFGETIQHKLNSKHKFEEPLDPFDNEYFQQRLARRANLTTGEKTNRKQVSSNIYQSSDDSSNKETIAPTIEAVIDAFCNNIFDKITISKHHKIFLFNLSLGPQVTISCNLHALLLFLESHPGIPMRIGKRVDTSGSQKLTLLISGIKTASWKPVRYPYQFTEIHLDTQDHIDEIVRFGIVDIEELAEQVHNSTVQFFPKS